MQIAITTRKCCRLTAVDGYRGIRARAMSHARWAKVPAAKRRQIMQKVRAHGGGRKRDPDRCYCGAHTWHTATLRGFDCCKRAGKFP
jgi:hypothetical protein